MKRKIITYECELCKLHLSFYDYESDGWVCPTCNLFGTLDIIDDEKADRDSVLATRKLLKNKDYLMFGTLDIIDD